MPHWIVTKNTLLFSVPTIPGKVQTENNLSHSKLAMGSFSNRTPINSAARKIFPKNFVVESSFG
jgi:hypothetical protein